MRRTKILFAIWAIIVLIIIGLLTTLGFILKDISDDYQVLETELEKAAKEYAYKFALLSESDTIIVTSEELIELGYLEPLKRDDDVCSGYAIIHVDDNYQYDVYITCDKYTTRGYQEQ